MRSLSHSFTSVLLAGAAFFHPAAAQVGDSDEADAAMDEIVVTGRVSTFGATKSDIPILETARSVSVIDADKFLERGALTLDDTLAYTAGVVGDSFGFATRGDFPFVRGLRVPEYLDNIQVLFGSFNNTRSDVYTLEQVEVLKGPASVLYGQGSPGGIFNTVSKKASRDYLGREVVFEYGTFDRFQAATDLGIDLTGDGALTGRLVAVYRDSDTQVDFVEDDVFVIAPSLTYEDEMTRATVLFNYTDRQGDTAQQFTPLDASACVSDQVSISIANTICAAGIAEELDASFYAGDPNFNRYDTSATSVTAYLERQLTDFLALEATGRYRDAEVDYQQAWVTFNFPGNPRLLPNGGAFGRSWFKAPSTFEQYGADARLRANFETGAITHEVLAGVNYQNVENQTRRSDLTQGNAVLFPAFNVFSPIYDGSEIPPDAAFDAAEELLISEVEFIGVYINNQITVGDFVVNAGVRFDDTQTGNGQAEQDDDAVTFSAGILYKTPFGLNPYFSYAESFEPVVGVDNITGQALKPSEGRQFEAGLKYQPPGTRTYITAAYFDIEQSNILDSNALPTEPSQQEGVSDIRGFEIEGQTIIGDFSLDASFSYIETEDPNGVRFEAVPETQAAAWGVWTPSDYGLDGLRIGAGVRYTGGSESNGVSAPSPFAPGLITEPEPFVVETDGYTLVDALISYDFDFVTVSVNARNLFDNEFYAACLARGDCFVGERRTVVGRVAFRF